AVSPSTWPATAARLFAPWWRPASVSTWCSACPATAPSSVAGTTATARESARVARRNDHPDRASTACPSPVASPPLRVEGRALARSGGFAMHEAERQARFRDKLRALAEEPER